MMLIATSVASALVALTAVVAPAESAAAAIPPMIVSVLTAGDVPASLLARVFAETDAIWRPSGVTFVWRRLPRETVSYARAAETGPYVPNTLRLNIGNLSGEVRDGRAPLGWIVFDDETTPQQEVYLSLANALAVLDTARGVVGPIAQMPIAQRETLLARAMGRALAHELGHYLLASKVHTKRGLMKAILSATELFTNDRNGMTVEPAQGRAVVARLRGEPRVAG